MRRHPHARVDSDANAMRGRLIVLVLCSLAVGIALDIGCQKGPGGKRSGSFDAGVRHDESAATAK